MSVFPGLVTSQPNPARRLGALTSLLCAAMSGRLNSGRPRLVARLIVIPVTITLREITEENAQSVLALLHTRSGRVRHLGDRLAGGGRRVPAGEPVVPSRLYRRAAGRGRHVELERRASAPEIIDPWFLWKLLIDHRPQGKDYGREVVRQIVELMRGQGATELLISHVPGEGGPAGFYARLGSVPTAELDPQKEIILRRLVHE